MVFDALLKEILACGAWLRKFLELIKGYRADANNPSFPAKHFVQVTRSGEHIKASRLKERTKLLSPDMRPWEAASVPTADYCNIALVWPCNLFLLHSTCWAHCPRGKRAGTAAHEQKQINYYDLAAESREDGWRTVMYPAEVESWEFVIEHSIERLWKS